MFEELRKAWAARLAEYRERCPSSCHGEIDELERCMEELLTVLESQTLDDFSRRGLV